MSFFDLDKDAFGPANVFNLEENLLTNKFGAGVEPQKDEHAFWKDLVPSINIPIP